MKTRQVTILRPSNFHAHMRGGTLANAIAAEVMAIWNYILVMPNNPITRTLEELKGVITELEGLKEKYHCYQAKFLFTVYFSGLLTPHELEKIVRYMDGRFGIRVKYYPPHPDATTGSGHGMPLRSMLPTLSAMEELSVPFLGHFESVTDKNGNTLPHADREAYSLNNDLPWLLDMFPDLLICIEHLSTAVGAGIVKNDRSGRLSATVTPQHLHFTAQDLHNHLKCMPIVKTPDDRAALQELVVAGRPNVFAGDDTAAHPNLSKMLPIEHCASGCYLPAQTSIALYTAIFNKHCALDTRFENFMSLNGPRWYTLPGPSYDDRITINEIEWGGPEPASLPNNDVVVPLGYFQSTQERIKLSWRVAT